MARIVGSPGGFLKGDIMTLVSDDRGAHVRAFARLPIDEWERLCDSGRGRVTFLGETDVADDTDVLVWGSNEGPDDAIHMSAGDFADRIGPCVDELFQHEADYVRDLDQEADEVRGGRPLFYLDGSKHGLDDVRYALVFDRQTYWDGSTHIGTFVDWGKCEPGGDCEDWIGCHGIESFADVTVNLGRGAQVEGCVCLDENNFRGIKDFLVENGLAEDVGFSIPSGFCEYPMVRLTDRMMEVSRPAPSPTPADEKVAPVFGGMDAGAGVAAELEAIPF